MNAYRVLLTRSRDGVIVYLPDDREFDQTGEILLQAGLAPLAESIPAAAAEDVVPYGNGA